MWAVCTNMMQFSVTSIPRRACIALIRGYQIVLSPLFPAVCRYVPSCSQYAIEAFRQYGAIKGGILTVWRLMRCNPWGGYGLDPPRWFTEDPPDQPIGADERRSA